MKTHTQALDTLFHGKDIRLQSVYCLYIYVITSVSSDEIEGKTFEPHLFWFMFNYKGEKKEKKREDEWQLGVGFSFSVTLLFPISLP